MTIIRVKKKHPVVPGFVYRQTQFKFHPIEFIPESDRLQDRPIKTEVQLSSYQQFVSNPRQPMVYCVTGNPDDSKALLFAAHLVEIHCKSKNSNPHWESIYGGFNNQLLDRGHEGYSPTILVLNNLTVDSTNVKLEKTRDLITFYSKIPRIIVACGTDPLSFITTKLHTPVHGITYFSESLMKQRMDVF